MQQNEPGGGLRAFRSHSSGVLFLLVAMSLAGGCSSSSFEGNALALRLEAGPDSVSVAAGQGATGRWEIDALLLAPTAIEIVPCADVDHANELSTGLPKHVESTPFQSGTSGVWPVVGGSGDLYSAKSIEPPTDEYCAVRLLIAPLDNDGIRGSEYPELIGYSLSVRATFDSMAQSASRSVSATSTLRVESQIQLDEAPVLIDGPASLVLSIDVDAIFESVDPDAQPAEVAREMLGAVPNAVSARVSR